MRKSVLLGCVIAALGTSGCGVSLLGGRMVNVYIMFSDDAECSPAIEAPSQLKDFSLIPQEAVEGVVDAYMKGPGGEMIEGTVGDKLKDILTGPDSQTTDYPNPPTPFPDDNDMGFPTDEDKL